MTRKEEDYVLEAFGRHVRNVTKKYFEDHPDFDEILDLEDQGWHLFINLSTLEISFQNEENFEKNEHWDRIGAKFKGYFYIGMRLFAQRGMDGIYIDSDGIRAITENCVYKYMDNNGIEEYSQMPECCQIPPEEIAKREAEERAYREELERRRKEKERIRAEHAYDPNAELLALIIPDVHGRPFWKEAVTRFPDIPVIFLGDYLDPYWNYIEKIGKKEAIANFHEILEYKNRHAENVTLLLGNHDIHYLMPDFDCSRKDKDNAIEIGQIYENNMGLFKMAKCMATDKKQYLFTHAGVLPGWLDLRMPDVKRNDCQSICNALNEAMKEKEFLFQLTKDASWQRGGRIKFGSPVWADVTEHGSDDDSVRLTGNVCQIFGHTQQEEDPIYKEWYCCLDCRRAFILTKSGFIMEIGNPMSEKHS